jgi:CBS domain-containing protein
MTTREIMHADVVSVRPDDGVLDAAKLMLEHGISGVLVMDGGNLVGILTEGDLIRRIEVDTGRKRSAFRNFFVGPGKQASEYVRASGRKVHEVMTREVLTVPDTAELVEVVDIMEEHHVKRVPVVVGRSVIGIISRSDLLRAFIAAAKRQSAKPMTDDEIRNYLISHLEKQKWYAQDLVQISVNNGVVTFNGAVMDQRQMEALEVAAENIPGVKRVNDRLVWIDPISGTGFDANGHLIEPGQSWDSPPRLS